MGCNSSRVPDTDIAIGGDENAAHWNSQYTQYAKDHEFALASRGETLRAAEPHSPRLSRRRSSSLSFLADLPGALSFTQSFNQKSKPVRVVAGFEVLRMLGEGSFGQVYEAKRNGQRCAIKVMPRPPPKFWHPMMKRGGTTFSSIKVHVTASCLLLLLLLLLPSTIATRDASSAAALRCCFAAQLPHPVACQAEVAALKKIQHPNCVHLYDVIIDETAAELYLVLEIIEGGPSMEMGKDGAQPTPLAEGTVWSYTRHLLMGLE